MKWKSMVRNRSGGGGGPSGTWDYIFVPYMFDNSPTAKHRVNFGTVDNPIYYFQETTGSSTYPILYGSASVDSRTTENDYDPFNQSSSIYNREYFSSGNTTVTLRGEDYIGSSTGKESRIGRIIGFNFYANNATGAKGTEGDKQLLVQAMKRMMLKLMPDKTIDGNTYGVTEPSMTMQPKLERVQYRQPGFAYYRRKKQPHIVSVLAGDEVSPYEPVYRPQPLYAGNWGFELCEDVRRYYPEYDTRCLRGVCYNATNVPSELRFSFFPSTMSMSMFHYPGVDLRRFWSEYEDIGYGSGFCHFPSVGWVGSYEELTAEYDKAEQIGGLGTWYDKLVLRFNKRFAVPIGNNSIPYDGQSRVYPMSNKMPWWDFVADFYRYDQNTFFEFSVDGEGKQWWFATKSIYAPIHPKYFYELLVDDNIWGSTRI